MRGDIGRHANGDAAGAVDQQVRKTGGQNFRLLPAFIIGGAEIDRVLADVFQQQHGGRRQAGFGVAHRGWRIAVHAAEIALPVDQPHAHGKALRHPHHRVVNRAVAMRMVFAHHFANIGGGFAIGPIRRVAGVMHGIQDAPMHRLQPVPRIW